MALTSSSTFEDCHDQYMDNLNYRDDLTKTTNFVEACRALLLKRPASQGTDGQNMSWETLQAELKEAQSHLIVIKGASTSSKRSSFTRGKAKLFA